MPITVDPYLIPYMEDYVDDMLQHMYEAGYDVYTNKSKIINVLRQKYANNISIRRKADEILYKRLIACAGTI